jgi:hypothetical protein
MIASYSFYYFVWYDITDYSTQMKQLNYFIKRIGIRLFLARLSAFYPAFKYYKVQ